VAAFIPYIPNSRSLELLYGAIDVGFMFGLLAVYLHCAAQVGRIGLASFVCSFTAIASIVGPDANMFGIDFYWLGASVFLLGLIPLALQLVRHGVLRLAGASWSAAAGLGILGTLAASTMAITASGAALGFGFAVAGLGILRHHPA
jgi:hypothetical protein